MPREDVLLVRVYTLHKCQRINLVLNNIRAELFDEGFSLKLN